VPTAQAPTVRAATVAPGFEPSVTAEPLTDPRGLALLSRNGLPACSSPLPRSLGGGSPGALARILVSFGHFRPVTAWKQYSECPSRLQDAPGEGLFAVRARSVLRGPRSGRTCQSSLHGAADPTRLEWWAASGRCAGGVRRGISPGTRWTHIALTRASLARNPEGGTLRGSVKRGGGRPHAQDTPLLHKTRSTAEPNTPPVCGGRGPQRVSRRWVRPRSRAAAEG